MGSERGRKIETWQTEESVFRQLHDALFHLLLPHPQTHHLAEAGAQHPWDAYTGRWNLIPKLLAFGSLSKGWHFSWLKPRVCSDWAEFTLITRCWLGRSQVTGVWRCWRGRIPMHSVGLWAGPNKKRPSPKPTTAFASARTCGACPWCFPFLTIVGAWLHLYWKKWYQ